MIRLSGTEMFRRPVLDAAISRAPRSGIRPPEDTFLPSNRRSMQYTFLIVHKILAVILSLLGVVSMEGQANAFESPSAYETAIDFGKSVDQGVFESSTEWRSAPCAADGSPATVETPFWTIAATEVVSRAPLRERRLEGASRPRRRDESSHVRRRRAGL